MNGGADERNTSSFSPTIGRSVSLEHAAELMRCSRRTVYHRIKNGLLETIRTHNGSMRVTVESLGAYLRVEHERERHRFFRQQERARRLAQIATTAVLVGLGFLFGGPAAAADGNPGAGHKARLSADLQDNL